MLLINNGLLVVANGEHAALYYGKSPEVRREVLISPQAQLRSHQLRSSRPGASFHSFSSARHAFAPRHDPHQMAERGFAAQLARRINQLVRERHFVALFIVAPDRTLAAIRGRLNGDAEARIVGTLAKDCTKIPQAKMRQFLPVSAGFRAPPHQGLA